MFTSTSFNKHLPIPIAVAKFLAKQFAKSPAETFRVRVQLYGHESTKMDSFLVYQLSLIEVPTQNDCQYRITTIVDSVNCALKKIAVPLATVQYMLDHKPRC